MLASVLISFGMTGIAGAGIKFVATMPQFLVFALFAMALRYTSSISFRRLLFFIPVAGVAIVVRVLLSIGAGTYIFGPLFFHTSPDLMLQVFPPWLCFAERTASGFQRYERTGGGSDQDPGRS